ncbi:MAG: pirin family protein [Pyrinomonadaceae bacterium]|nr:pirin family protein [Sphingobacteriaceae bacterium]
MKTTTFKASERGTKDIGWLKSKFTLSFSDYANPSLSSFGTLIALNDDIVKPGKGFGTHPHQNMEIISIMLEGSMNHKDSMGYNTVVHKDYVQIMGAGSGLFHEEYNIGENDVNFLQIWIQPKLLNTTPRYQQRNFSKEERKNTLTKIISNEEGSAHCWINQNAILQLGYFENGFELPYSFNSVNRAIFVFVIKGEIKVAGTKLTERDAIGIWDTENILLESNNSAEFLIIETVINQK